MTSDFTEIGSHRSTKSRPLRECKSSAKASNTFRSFASLTHSRNRRWHVWYGGNLPGKSHQRAPPRAKSTTRRSRFHDLHGVFVRVFGQLRVYQRAIQSKTIVHRLVLHESAIREFYPTIFEIASNIQTSLSAQNTLKLSSLKKFRENPSIYVVSSHRP